MKKFALPTGEAVVIDDDDWARVSAFSWRKIKSGNDAGFSVGTTIRKGTKRVTVLLHRFILSAKRGVEVDHKNGDRFDNRKAMLRLLTAAQNRRAFRRKSAGKSSRFRGVSWSKRQQKWRAFLSKTVRKVLKIFYLGQYDLEIDAAKAYNAAAIHHGFLPEALNPV